MQTIEWNESGAKRKHDAPKTADKVGSLCDFLSLATELWASHKSQTLQSLISYAWKAKVVNIDLEKASFLARNWQMFLAGLT